LRGRNRGARGKREKIDGKPLKDQEDCVSGTGAGSVDEEKGG